MRQGVIHRRRLLHIPPEYWIVVDDFRGPGEHTFDFNYHLAPDVEVSSLEHDEAELVVRAEQAGLLLGLYASRPVKTELICGQTAPIGGWVSHGYGEKRPSSTVRATLAGPTPAAAMTFLALTATAPALRRLQLEDPTVIACTYEHHGCEDLAVFSTGESEIAVEDFRMRGEFFWLRMKGGVLQQMAAIRARTLYYRGKDVLEDALCAPFVAS